MQSLEFASDAMKEEQLKEKKHCNVASNGGIHAEQPTIMNCHLSHKCVC